MNLTKRLTHIKILRRKLSRVLVSLTSQVEEEVIQLHVGLPVDALTHKESQLVGVLAGSGHSDHPLKHKRKINLSMSIV